MEIAIFATGFFGTIGALTVAYVRRFQLATRR